MYYTIFKTHDNGIATLQSHCQCLCCMYMSEHMLSAENDCMTAFIGLVTLTFGPLNRFTRMMCFHRANFGLLGPFCSRVRLRHTTHRQTDTTFHFIMHPPTEVGAILGHYSLQCCHHGIAIVRVHPVHLINAEQLQAAADSQVVMIIFDIY